MASRLPAAPIPLVADRLHPAVSDRRPIPIPTSPEHQEPARSVWEFCVTGLRYRAAPLLPRAGALSASFVTSTVNS